jgi:hypothetical protein
MSQRLPRTLTPKLIQGFSQKLKDESVTSADCRQIIDALSTTQVVSNLTDQITGNSSKRIKHAQSIEDLLKSLLSHFGKGDPASQLIEEILSEEQSTEYFFSEACFERTRILLTLFV